MTLQPMPDYEKILKTISQWPALTRLTLAQDILSSVMREQSPRSQQVNTLSQAVGLLASDSPPPMDDEVQEWLATRRLEKYGR